MIFFAKKFEKVSISIKRSFTTYKCFFKWKYNLSYELKILVIFCQKGNLK